MRNARIMATVLYFHFALNAVWVRRPRLLWEGSRSWFVAHGEQETRNDDGSQKVLRMIDEFK